MVITPSLVSAITGTSPSASVIVIPLPFKIPVTIGNWPNFGNVPFRKLDAASGIF